MVTTMSTTDHCCTETYMTTPTPSWCLSRVQVLTCSTVMYPSLFPC